MDKIYSRPRIRIPKIKHSPKKVKKRNPIRTWFHIILVTSVISIGSFVYSAYPIFVASCQTAAGSKAVLIVNEEVQKVMSNYQYHDLVNVQKDGHGDIVLMQYNTVLINEITTKIASNIQKAIDNTPRIMVYINFGSVSGVSILSNIGPKFDIELEAAGKINTDLRSDFESFNVNQTMHKIYLDLSTSISILTPIGVYGRDIQSEVLLTEAVIVGDVPDTYYNLEGITRDDTLNMFE